MLAISAAIGLFTSRVADASQCSRWDNGLHPCDGLVMQPTCQQNESTWMDGQLRNYFNWLYSDDPQRACYKMLAKYWSSDPDAKDTATIVQIDPEFYMCTFDWDGDGHVYGTPNNPTPQGKTNDYDAWKSPVYLETVPREPECDLVPEGLYKTLPGTGTAGGDFSQSAREAIIAKNYTNNGNVMRSDAATHAGLSDANPVFSRFTLPPYRDDPEMDDFQVPTTANSTAQIDHIIPRKDIRGCPCGTNHPRNAAVITAGLNREMSNKMNHPKRIAMLQAFVPGYVPPVALEIDNLDLESDAREVNVSAESGAAPELDAGGCAAAPGASGALLLLAGIALLVRRPSARANP